MREIAVIGAGELGGEIAHALAAHDVAREIRLIDDAGQVAAGKALDIAQAAPVEGFATRLSGSTDLASAGGATLVVVADRFEGGDWQGEEALALLHQLRPCTSGALIVWAAATGREAIERGVRELHIPRERLFGSAPEALAGAVRALVALETNSSPGEVALTVLGIPPARIVVPWNDVTIGGFAATRLLDDPARRRVTARLVALWPPGPHALASATAKVIDAISGRTRCLASCFVAGDDSAGIRARTFALPVRLGRSGIEETVLPDLGVVERIALDNAIQL